MTQSTQQHFRGTVTRDRIVPNDDSRQWDAGYHRTKTQRVNHAQNVDEFRVTTLKAQSKKKTTVATGQYTRLTSVSRNHELLVYRDNHNLIFRNNPNDPSQPILILQNTDQGWFVVTPLTESEKQSLKPFIGASGLDPDNAIENKPRTIKHTGKSSQKIRHNKFEKGLAKQANRRSLISSVQFK